MWWRILSRSFRNRQAHFALAILSVVLGASLVAALSNLSLDVPQKVGSQLRAYGANILILPQASTLRQAQDTAANGEAYISQKGLSFLEQGEIARSIASYLPYLYGQVEIAGQRVVLAGTWLDRVQRASPWWQVTGRWPGSGEERQEALVGAQVAQKLGLGLDKEMAIEYGGKAQSFKVVGIVNTGAAEDNQVLVSLSAAQGLMGQGGKVGLVRVSALTQEHPLSHLSQFIEQGTPGTEARVIGQIARAERQVLSKVQLLMALVAGLICVASGLVILSTMTATWLERTPEIGLMKALGASDRRIAGLLGAEVSIIALSGGVVGFLMGYLLAQFIGHRVFGSAVSPRLLAFLVSLGVATVVTFLGSVLPLRRALRVDPAVTLRGE